LWLVGVAFAAMVVLQIAASRKHEDASTTRLKFAMTRLVPLHQKISKPGPHDWLANHREPGQTFAQYLRCGPVLPRGERKVLYIQPIGTFTENQEKIVNQTADYMARFFNLQVRTLETIPDSVVPAVARRPSRLVKGDEQLLTGYILHNVLKPKLPDDAAALIGFTSNDLWPGKGWNFVFGQATLRQRVGVWSIYRNGFPERGEEAYRQVLMRTIKTAVHETGHMFSMLHCTRYECIMCGSNHQEESDRRPVMCCPECMAKVCWATETPPIQRYEELMAFCQKHGFKDETAYFEKAIKALKAK
jgi:archaemetzincin